MSRAGNKAFDRCDVKVVEFKDFVFVDDDEEKIIRATSAADETRTYAGTAAVLHCPRTEDDRVSIESQYSNHRNRLAALKSVQKLAGAVLCRDCRFSSMTPVEVSIERKQLADAEAERMESYKLMEAARAEIEDIARTQLPE